MERCYHCKDLGHNMKNCPQMVECRKCYACGKLGHISSACPGTVDVPSNNESSPVIIEDDEFVPFASVNSHVDCTSYQDRTHPSGLATSVDGVEVYCVYSTATQINILQKELWKKISREGRSRAVLDTNRRGKIRSIFGDIFYSLGRVNLKTSISREVYDLEWVVVPESNMPIKACLGNPLMLVACVYFTPSEGVIVEPYKSKRDRDIEELVKKELDKAKEEVGKRMDVLKEQQIKAMDALKERQWKYLDEQLEIVTKKIKSQKF